MNSSNACSPSGHSTRPSTDATDEGGYALIAVVGVLAVLSVIAVVLSERGRIGASSANAFLEETRDLYAVEAGMAAAIRAVSSDSEFRQEGRLALEMSIGDRRLSILITDESHKVDVNHASPTEIAAAFVALGADTSTAQALSRRVVDWRDNDDRRQLDGAEVADYLVAGMAAIPRNDRFIALDEVETVLGMPQEMATNLHEQFTVLPSFGGRVRTAETATGLNPTSSGELERQDAGMPSSDGITRRADTANRSGLVGIQIDVMRGDKEPEQVYFEVLLHDHRDQ